MKVFKFGGASVKDAKSVRNVAEIIGRFPEDDIWIVVSAMGKSTNKLEQILSAYWRNNNNKEELFSEFQNFHLKVVEELFPFSEAELSGLVNQRFKSMKSYLQQMDRKDFDKNYDHLVSNGEWLSTTIVCAYLQHKGMNAHWADAASMIHTNGLHREALVNWEKTEKALKKKQSELEKGPTVGGKFRLITQGFIGSFQGQVTTLGREGSDFSAAIIAWCLNSEEVVIWKDVPGMLNADPKYYPKAVKLKNISYREAIELSYFGASVIHPKTVKPLQNKGIPLRVRSFIDFEEEGSTISSSSVEDASIPSFIFKQDQVLISVSPQDFSFIMEEGMGEVLTQIRAHRLRANLMQNSALSFSLCMDNRGKRVDALIEDLSANYRVLYNNDVSLLTIRHYNEQILEELLEDKEVLVEQRSRQTARFVVKGSFDRTT